MKPVFKLACVTALAVSSMMYSCRTDNKDSVSPAITTCDTAHVTFTTIKPIFDAKCTGCHNELSTEASAKSWANFAAIVGAVKHESGFMAMPKGGAKLNSCEISNIEVWYNGNK